MRLTKLVIVFIFSLLFSISGFSQNATIRGKVTESSKGEPVMYTTVYLKGTKYGIQTNSDGFYTLSQLPPGTYLLVVKSIEYDSVGISITVKANDIVQKNIIVKKRSVELTGVTIDANSTEKTEHVGISVTTITPVEIKMVPAIGEPDIAQYMQNIPGIISSGDAGGQLYIRGGAPVQNEVLLDGMLIYNPFHSIGLFSVFDNDIIKNADIYTGGFNAQYGGRVSAVMDITTKDGNKKRLSGKVSASTFGGKVMLEGPLKKIKENDENSGSTTFVVSAKSSYLQQVSPILYSYANGKEGLPFDYTDLYGKMSFNAGNGSKLNIFGFDFSDGVHHYHGLDSLGWRSFGFGGNFVVVPQNSQTIVTGHFAYSNYKIGMQETIYDSVQTSSIKGFNFGLSFADYYGKNQLDYGVELIGNSTNFNFHNEVGHLIEQTANSTEFGAFIKYRMLFFNDKLVLEPGFRYQYYATLNTGSPEPRMGAKYNVTKKFRLKASGGLYSQNLVSAVPEKDVVNLFYGFLDAPSDIPTSYVDQQGKTHPVTQDLQKAWHAIFGFEYDLIKNLSLNVEGYLKDFTQLTNLNRDKLFEDDAAHANYPDAVKKDFIIETGKAYGIDFEAKYSYKHMYFWAVYDLGYVTRWDGMETYRPHFDRRHNINLVASYKFGKNDDRTWEIDARFNYGSGFPFTPTQGFYQNQTFGGGLNTNYTNTQGSLGTLYGAYNSAQLPDYARLDINLKKTIEFKENSLLELSAGATNTLNRQNIFYVDRITSATVYQLPIMPTVSIGWTF
ncbi:MAG TPA: TonB-dependent receptor [Bacteroidia bacterium]|nr:TonB-dependent receptor [Bacteroidia bacterium]